MIDAENEIFDIVRRKVVEVFPSIYMTGEYVKSPPSFPCVSLIEMDNAALVRTQTTDSSENHVSVMYELNVYSNKQSGKKMECRSIVSVVDDALEKLGFYRIMLNPIPNFEDATIYRMVGRYRAVIGKDKTIYRR